MQKTLNRLQHEGTDGQIADFLRLKVGERSLKLGMMFQRRVELIQQLLMLIDVHHVPLHSTQNSHICDGF